MASSVSDCQLLIVQHLTDLRRAVQRSCLTRGMRQHVDDVCSGLTLKLLENECAVVRQYQGRGPFLAFLGIVVDRFVLDYQTREWGKWRPSAVARKLGPAAVLLDQLISRDAIPCAEAVAMVATRLHLSIDHVATLRDDLMKSRARLRWRSTALTDIPAPCANACALELGSRQRKLSQLRTALASALDTLDPADRRLLQLRFVQNLRVSAVAQHLGLAQKQLYRQYDRLFVRLRRYLNQQGFEDSLVESLLVDGIPVIDGVLDPSREEERAA